MTLNKHKYNTRTTKLSHSPKQKEEIKKICQAWTYYKFKMCIIRVRSKKNLHIGNMYGISFVGSDVGI